MMTVSTTPSSSPLLGSHFSDTVMRQLVDDLVDDAEQQAIDDTVALEMEPEEVVDEMVCGWTNTVSMPKPYGPTKRMNVRKRNPKSNIPDIDISRIVVRCVNEDYSSEHHKSAWKANVEPGTYRYICNNGIYRSTKFANNGSEWITTKRSKSVSEKGITPEIRQAKRSLIKDLDQHFRSSDRPSPTGGSSSAASRSLTGIYKPIKPESQASARSFNYTAPSQPSSTSNDQLGYAQGARKEPKDPNIVKSMSDLFVEKFSSKMSALEKEIREGMRKSPATTPKAGTTASAAVTVINGRKHQPFSDMPPDAAKFLAKQADDISRDVFTVKPVTRAEQPLKPLEKLTPHQKQLETKSIDSDRTSNDPASNPESPALSTSFMTAMNAFAQIHHQQLKQPHNNKSSHAQNKHTGRQSGSLSSSSISDSESLSGVRNALTLTNHDIERMRMRTFTNQMTLRDYNKFINAKSKTQAAAAAVAAAQQSAAVANKGLHPRALGKARANLTKQHTSSAPLAAGSHHHRMTVKSLMKQSNSDDISSVTSDPASDAFITNTAIPLNKNFRDDASKSLSLPEISGKSLSVTVTNQRML